MNILHLKYAVEIAKTGSLNKAAENLYMGQPNLSRAIRELEAGLGITIFERTPRGMVVTPDGEAFLQYAVRILAQIDEMESVFRDGKKRRLTLLQRRWLPLRARRAQSRLRITIRKPTRSARSEMC